ncbi:MAG: ABC transporter permease, partial [Sphaerochaetaceae bacterium]
MKKTPKLLSFTDDLHIRRLTVIIFGWMIFIALTKFSKFYSLLNFQTMASQFPEFGLMSLGVMVTMITGGIDLSVVGIANLTSILNAFILLRFTDEMGSLPPGMILLVFALAVIIGALAGIFNGLLISKFHIPPILATMGSGELFTGICLAMTNGNAVSKFSRDYAQTINAKMFSIIPVQLIIFAVMALIIWFLLSKTSYGTKIYLLGTSSKAAYFSGLKVDTLIIKTYMLSGMAA